MNHRSVAAAVSITGGRRGKKNHVKHNINSILHPYTEKCCILPVPFYNNTSIIITVAKMRRRKKIKKCKMKNRKMFKINTA